MLKEIKPYIKKNLINVIFYFTASTVLWGINIVVPILSGYYIDSLVKNESSIIFIYVILISLINIVNIFIQYISAFLTTKLNNIFLFQISNDVYQKLFKTDINEINNIEHQYFIDQVNKDIITIVDYFAGNICTFIFHFTTIVVSIIIVYRADKMLSLFIILLLPIYLYTYKRYRGK